MPAGARWGGCEVQLHPWEFISPGPRECLARRARTHETTISREADRGPGHSHTCHCCCPCCHQFLQCSRQHTGMQNASVLLSRRSGERKSRGFVVSPPRASAACRRAAAPSPGSTQPQQHRGTRDTMAGAVLLGAWQSTGTQK